MMVRLDTLVEDMKTFKCNKILASFHFHWHQYLGLLINISY